MLDALHDAGIDVMICRNEGGAAMMAEAYGKLTGRPGICFVTRGPGATNASHGVHIAAQDLTPMILICAEAVTKYDGARSPVRPFLQFGGGRRPRRNPPAVEADAVC